MKDFLIIITFPLWIVAVVVVSPIVLIYRFIGLLFEWLKGDNLDHITDPHRLW
jgi:hypothetical protein